MVNSIFVLFFCVVFFCCLNNDGNKMKIKQKHKNSSNRYAPTPSIKFCNVWWIQRFCSEGAMGYTGIILATHNDACVIEGPPYWQVWETGSANSMAAMPWSLGRLGFAYDIRGVRLMRKIPLLRVRMKKIAENPWRRIGEYTCFRWDMFPLPFFCWSSTTVQMKNLNYGDWFPWWICFSFFYCQFTRFILSGLIVSEKKTGRANLRLQFSIFSCSSSHCCGFY